MLGQDGAIALRQAQPAANNVVPQGRSIESRVGEGIVRCGISSAVAYVLGSILPSTTTSIVDLATQKCVSLSKLDFLSLYGEKMRKHVGCYNPTTCYNACTRAMDGTIGRLQALT